jgi:glycosyltransferase involved in cell wall biosynthesis
VVEALRKARLPAARYTLFGALTQPYTRDLRKAADRSAGIELRTYGPYDPFELPELLADVDAVIVPSLVWETFSIVAREALACGVPVIASRLGALPEAIREGESGLLFTPGATSELAELLQRLDADRPTLARLREGIAPTDWIAVAERTRRLEAVLEEVCDRASTWGEREAAQPDLEALRTLLTATL